MDELHFSFIIPVYNRPDEIQELLESISNLTGNLNYEVIVIEDGSTITSKDITQKFTNTIDISYYYKPNTGPGDSRNYGMQNAKGNYFIILDSDCILPNNYLEKVRDSLQNNYVDCYGGPDNAHESFSTLQKAINFAMTSIVTTGGIRGKSAHNFQPRSFNMGISKKAFQKTGGFGNIHPGEDPDLSIRLWNLGFETKLIPEAFVYHKRRISWKKFYIQVNKFGLARPILNQWHPQTEKLIYWFPTIFSFGFIFSLIFYFFNIALPLKIYGTYFLVVFIIALFSTKNIVIAFQSLIAICIQFFGYGFGFFKSTIALKIFKVKPESYFPNLFFDHAK